MISHAEHALRKRFKCAAKHKGHLTLCVCAVIYKRHVYTGLFLHLLVSNCGDFCSERLPNKEQAAVIFPTSDKSHSGENFCVFSVHAAFPRTVTVTPLTPWCAPAGVNQGHGDRSDPPPTSWPSA